MNKVIQFPRKHLRNGDESTDYGRRWNLSMLLILSYGEWIEEQLRGELRLHEAAPADLVVQDAAATAHAIIMLSEMPPDRVQKLYDESDAMPCASYHERRAVMHHIMGNVLAYVEDMD
jgi:hypothetical protein